MESKRIVLVGILFLFTLGALSSFPLSLHAQSNSQMIVTGKTYINKTATNSNLDSSSFDWRWLLPLLAIPIIFYIWQVAYSEDQDDQEIKTHPQALAGIKGGKASTKKKYKTKHTKRKHTY